MVDNEILIKYIYFLEDKLNEEGYDDDDILQFRRDFDLKLFKIFSKK